jgi:nucleotide-binding universal stress UspA family protein
MTRVLIAFDGTDASRSAGETAHRLFGDGAEYLAISVFEVGGLGAAPTPMAWGMVYQYEAFAVTPEDRAVAHDLAEAEAAEAALDAGIEPTETIGETGDPADAIIAAAHEHRVDVIVVGSHDRSWFSRLFDPSVATQVVRQADIPVLVVR